MIEKCKWYKASIPGHLESSCGVWIEADMRELIWMVVRRVRCHRCKKRIIIGVGRLKKEGKNETISRR